MKTARASRMEKPDAKVDGWIDDLVGVFFDPIIVLEPGWEVPDWIRKEMPIARLAQQMKGLKDPAEVGLASELECLAYLSNASLVAPMHNEWVDIYFYIFTRVMKQKGKEVPADLVKEEISDYQKGLLREFREWLWKQRVKARKERKAGERAEARAEAAAKAPKQLQMF